MKKFKYLLIISMPLIFMAGCIDGTAMFSLNKDGSGKVTFEGLFDSAVTADASQESYFLSQIEKMLTAGQFEAWDEVTWKFLDNGKCYFKGTAYFKDINKTDFYIGSIKSNLKIAFVTGKNPVLELKYLSDDIANNQAKSSPQDVLKAVNINLIIALPADIEKTDNFELLDRQTAMFAFKDGRFTSKNKTAKLTLVSRGQDLFNYKSEVKYAKKNYEKILKNIKAAVTAQNIELVKLNSQIFNSKMRQGLKAESQNNFNEALKIYKEIIDDNNSDKNHKAAATYQTGVCLLKMGRKGEAQAQFEYVINNYPLERAAALKSVKILQSLRLAEADKQQQQEQIPFVIDTSPGLYLEDVDPNIGEVTVIFSEPMKKNNWFYSSFARLPLPKTGEPFFDAAGLKWTLPVKLEPKKVYAIAINFSDAEEKVSNAQAGFSSVLGKKSEPFILVFATADREHSPTLIDEKIIEKCEKINVEL